MHYEGKVIKIEDKVVVTSGNPYKVVFVVCNPPLTNKKLKPPSVSVLIPNSIESFGFCWKIARHNNRQREQDCLAFFFVYYEYKWHALTFNYVVWCVRACVLLSLNVWKWWKHTRGVGLRGWKTDRMYDVVVVVVWMREKYEKKT